MATSTGPIRDEIDRLDAVNAAVAVGEYMLSIPIDLSLITAPADVVTDLILGHKFIITGKPIFVMTEAGVGAGASIVLVLDLDATEAGGNTALTEAGTGYGVCVLGTALSTDIEGEATDKITVRAKTVTVAFTSGKGTLLLRVKNVP